MHDSYRLGKGEVMAWLGKLIRAIVGKLIEILPAIGLAAVILSVKIYIYPWLDLQHIILGCAILLLLYFFIMLLLLLPGDGCRTVSSSKQRNWDDYDDIDGVNEGGEVLSRDTAAKHAKPFEFDETTSSGTLVNPATGWPMCGNSGVDAGGAPYGVTNHFDNDAGSP